MPNRGIQVNRRNSQENDKNQVQHLRYVQIDNYYGAHKNFKTDFRNKKYKNVYSQLIHRKPSQPEHLPLYYQDMLISIIKTVELSFVGKDHSIDSIEPFYYFGTKSIKGFFWLFLKERRIIDKQLVIDPAMKNKLSHFLTLVIDFTCKVAQHLDSNNDSPSAQKLFSNCYKNVVAHVISSSTSSILLLKKCGQFLLNYSLHCLNSQQNDKAYELILQGLQNQLNLLILLRYNFNEKKKVRKFSNKYAETLKTLSYFYLGLALYYEKTNRMYECSKVILQTVTIQQLIGYYNSKQKKWICSLEENYYEEKNKYLELLRVVNTFFTIEGIQDINTDVADSHKYRNKSHIQDNIKYYREWSKFQKNPKNKKAQNDTAKNPNLKGEGQKGMKNDGSLNSKVVKEVRFNLENDDSQDRTSHQLNMKRRSSSEISEDQLSSVLKAGQSFNDLKFNVRNKPLEHKKNDQNKIALKEKNKDMKTLEGDDILLFGQNFWEFSGKDVKRSKSNFQKVFKRQEYDIKRPGRKMSYTNVNFLQVNSLKNNKNLHSFLKQNTWSGVKKKTNDRGLFLQRREQNPDDYLKVNTKIKKWHDKSTKIYTDIFSKMHQLKQRKNVKSVLENRLISEQAPTQLSVEEEKKQLTFSKIENELELKKSKEKRMIGSKNMTGIKLFKQFLLQNKKSFNIDKPELFNPNPDFENQRRFMSFLVTEKPQRIDKLIEKNHWQAKNNIQFFKTEIESSNKKLSKSTKERCKSKADLLDGSKGSSGKVILDHSQMLRQDHFEQSSTNLFGTSLKKRAEQVVNLL